MIIEAKADVFHHHKGHKTGAKTATGRLLIIKNHVVASIPPNSTRTSSSARRPALRDVIVEAEQQFNQLSTGADHKR